MTSDAVALQALMARVGSLEDQNRRLKWGCIMIFAILSAAVLMGQAAPSPAIIEAQRFVLKDAKGNVRGWMGVIGNGSELTLGNGNAQPMMTLTVSTDGSDLHFFGTRNSGMTLSVNSSEPAISMIDAEGRDAAGITFAREGPSLALQDREGFSAVVGTTQIKASGNGEALRTSAASVVLLDSEKKVIWHAP